MSWVEGTKRSPTVRESAERKAFRRRKRRRRLKQAAAWVALAAVVLGAGYGGYRGAEVSWRWVRTETDWTKVRAVNVSPTRWIPEWQVAELTGIVTGQDLFDVDLELVRILLENHPRILSVDLHRRLWDRSVVIQVEERRPLAIVLDGGIQELALGGIALGEKPESPLRRDTARGPQLPLITGKNCVGVEPGVTLEDLGVRRALAFLALLEEYELSGDEWISEINVDDPEALVVYLLEHGTPIHIGNGRLSRTRLRAFLAVLEDLTRQGIRPESIDMRFANQIVVQEG